MLDIKKDLSPRELRWFGLIAALFLAVVGVVAVARFEAWTVAYFLWSLGGVLGLLYYLVPALQRSIYLGWMYTFLPIGWTISNLLLALIFYLILTPIGVMMRLVGKDPMERAFDPEAGSYWVEHDPGKERARYFRQF